MTTPLVCSVNVGIPRTVEWRGRHVRTAIWKEPISGPVIVQGVNAVGDDQADRRVHGGVDKALYAYAHEDYAWWSTLGFDVAAGTFGENLTTMHIDLNACHIGDRWHVGDALLEVSQPRSPCFKLGIRMGRDDFPDLFDEANRPGAYLRIVEPGTIVSGATIAVEPTALPAVRIGDLHEPDPTVLRLAVDDTRVPLGWRRAAARALGEPSGDTPTLRS